MPFMPASVVHMMDDRASKGMKMMKQESAKYAVSFLIIFILMYGLFDDEFRRRNQKMVTSFSVCRVCFLAAAMI